MKKIRLTSICSPKQWKTIPTKDLLDEGYPVYGANGVIGYCKEYNHTSDTIIIGCRGSCGNVNIARGKSYINGNAMCLDDLSSDVDILYLYYFLQNYDFRSVISGTTIPQVTKQGLEKIDVVVSSKENQREIVRQLQLLDSIIEERHKELRYFDALIKSRFIELFGDPVSNPKDWDVVPLGKRCGIITGNTPSRSEPENYGEYIEWIKSDNINTPFTFITKAQECLSEAGFDKCRFVEAGSILMTCIAGSINCIGNVAVTDRRVAFNQQINAIVPEQDEVLYLYWLMQLSKPMIHRTINMALKGILSKSQLSEIAFPFPPITLQEQFATFVEQTDKSKYHGEFTCEMEVAA